MNNYKKIAIIISVLLNIGFVFYIFMSKSNNETDDFQKVTSEKQISTQKEINIVMLGNSITHQGDWKEVLQREDVFNGGKPGWTTQQLSWVIKDFVIPNKPKVCFFKGGINDYTLGISTNRIYQNTCMVLDSIKNVGTHPVFTTVLYQCGAKERNLKIDSLNHRMEQFCQERGYDFMDLRPFLCENGDILDEYVQADNTHLTPKAYPQWAKAMKPILKKYNLE
ncbi:SGNH/GDSL hydrolase family protein [Galbibacter mesophilus]|uniref:SGNH/GDSL hydrolase family protein n=1 Tax=Galbibacter mesophilus TaxID=379069 RepID=UPI00191DB20C|nr:GDSL-type esterase/lipase family protein [Galbibacter mesophilus]MCM5664331.1 GDSL-type esterase/lipase family protein [Galbibacter mesophilus]